MTTETMTAEDLSLYGQDAAEWLRRWDAGRSVFSVDMGGMGPGYEQTIQITVSEILRHLLKVGYDTSEWRAGTDQWEADKKVIESFGGESKRIGKLQLSAAQWGAAMNLAVHIYMHGPEKTMADVPQNRHIQVSKSFPK